LQFLPRSGACSDLLMPEVSRHSGSQYAVPMLLTKPHNKSIN
jgi:hypothetical protein